MTISAVSFDLWDTVLDDESDEAARAKQGLQTKVETRHRMLLDALQKHHDVTCAEIDVAYGVANAAFYKAWQEDSITWTCHERLQVLLDGLSMSLPEDELSQLADAMGALEVDVPPDLLPGVKAAIQTLAENYQLCVVSDTIITPGTGLRRILDHHGLADYFAAFAFSDEVGRSKPHESIFMAACAGLDVEPDQVVHIGDRDNKDILGAQALGMKAILYTGKRDQDRFTTSADVVCEDHADLVGLIDTMADA
tara:strand:+ start:13706 stop:14461 length:756 start_codon:yes stop_codon:yes gene_type:complete